MTDEKAAYKPAYDASPTPGNASREAGYEAVRNSLRRFARRAKPPQLDVAVIATRHLLRGHTGEALLCEECRNG